jgi:ABC-type lipoprotein release transport system permease subunit
VSATRGPAAEGSRPKARGGGRTVTNPAANGLVNTHGNSLPLDPVTSIAAPVVLSLVTLPACYIPARRATRVNPLNALRTE